MKIRTLRWMFVAAIAVIVLSGTAIAQTPFTQFDGVLAKEVVATVSVTAPDVIVSDDLTVTDAVTAADLTATDDVSVGDDLAVTGGADFTTYVDVGTFFNLTNQTVIAVTAGATIAPTGSYQPLSSSGAVATSTTTAIANGDVLILRNTNAADTITIDGAGANVECNGDIVLGANDVLGLIYNGADWTCLFLRDNSA